MQKKKTFVIQGSKYSIPDLTRVFNPVSGGGGGGGGSSTMFEFPFERKLEIEGCATKEELEDPAAVFDSEGQRYLRVGKDGNTTDLTIGHYAGLVSFTINQVGMESVELGIYNAGVESSLEPFSAKGDSGSLVWHLKNGDKAFIVGQIHSGQNKGGHKSKHFEYFTPGL